MWQPRQSVCIIIDNNQVSVSQKVLARRRRTKSFIVIVALCVCSEISSTFHHVFCLLLIYIRMCLLSCRLVHPSTDIRLAVYWNNTRVEIQFGFANNRRSMTGVERLLFGWWLLVMFHRSLSSSIYRTSPRAQSIGHIDIVIWLIRWITLSSWHYDQCAVYEGDMDKIHGHLCFVFSSYWDRPRTTMYSAIADFGKGKHERRPFSFMAHVHHKY